VTLVAFATWLALHPLAYFLGHLPREPMWRSRAALVAYVLLLCTLPFQLAEGALFLRSAAATIAVSYSVKAFALARGRLRDPSVLHSFPRFVLWLTVPHDPRFPESAEARRLNRRLGWRRIARVLLKVAGVLALYVAQRQLKAWPVPYFVSATLTAMHFYVAATAITDSVAAIALLCGCEVDEIFRLPFLARSPADFWSRRWNLYIARFGARHIFFPLKAVSVTLAALAVFVASALMHEYIVLAIFGPGRAALGFMSAFFLSQCLGVLAQRLWLRQVRRRFPLRDELAIALHLLWFIPTSGLFFEPVGAMLHSWGLWWRPMPL
jgi:hypothetical protein